MGDALAIVRTFYSSLAEGDAPAAFALLDPHIEWTEAERSPYYAGTLHSPDAVLATVFQPIGAAFDNFVAAPSEFVAEGDRVVSFGIYSGVAKGTGRVLNAPFVHSWTVVDGRLRRFAQYTDSAAWKEALGKT